MADIRHDDDVDKRRLGRLIAGAAATLVLASVAGVWLAVSYVGSERQRAMQEWQIRLGIVADSRVAAVEDWVQGNLAALSDLAANESLQLYLTELAFAQWDRAQVTDEAAQAGYLYNLLAAAAEREGFAGPPSESAAIANVARPALAGIALVAGNGDPLAATPGMPPLEGALAAAYESAIGGDATLIDMFRSEAGPVTTGFALPVYGLQDDPGGSGIGVVIGVRVVGDGLYRRLRQPGEIARTAETYLVRDDGTTVTYLSPLADGTRPLELSLDKTTPDLGAAFGIANPGGFAVGRDHAGAEALITARAVAGTPWTLVRKVSRDEAMAPVDSRLNTILAVLVLLIVGVAVTIVAVWRHGTSLRAAQAASRFKVAAERFENMVKFMRVVTDSQPTEIVAVTAEGTYTYANRTAAEAAGMAPEDMMGKNVASVAGPIVAGAYAEINGRVIHSFAPERAVKGFDDGEGGTRWIRSAHMPLRGDRDYPPASLMILDDITDLTLETERSKRRLMQLVDTLVGVVDRRDPHSADHSARVAEVARAVAEEMGLDDVHQSTADMAARLMNLGKIYIPQEVLAKTSGLTDAEKALLAGSVEVSAEMVEKVEFEGPVVETLRQINETWDGRGRLGLTGERTLVTARVVAVANAFVGMLSPRAWRDGHDMDGVIARLTEAADTDFDRRVVLALVHHLENKGGRAKWAHFGTPPAEA